MKALPTWLTGADISYLTYRVVEDIFRYAPASHLETAERLGVDEADVLRAWAELQRVGVVADPETSS